MLSQVEEKSKEYRHTIVDLEGQLEQQGPAGEAAIIDRRAIACYRKCSAKKKL